MRHLFLAAIGAVTAAACNGGGSGTTEASGVTEMATLSGTDGTDGTDATAGTTAPTTGGPTSATTDETTTGNTTQSTQTTGEPTTDATAGTTTTATTTDTTTDTTTGGVAECAEITHFATGKTPATVLRVANGGADDPGCGAVDSPCASVEYAVSLAGPGTSVELAPGTYPGGIYLSDVTGTADAPIWIGGVPGEDRPVIDGGTEAMHLSRARYLVLHDLEVDGATGNGINVDDGGEYDNAEATRFVAFERLHIHHIGQGGNEDCLKLSGLNDFWILDGEYDHCGAGGSAVDHVGCHHGLIVGNNFHDNGSNAVQAKGGSEDIEIRGNDMLNCGQRAVNMGGSTGFEFFRPPLTMNGSNAEARDIRVVANAIVGGEVPLAFVGCVDCLAANNTIINPNQWLLRILQETVSDQGYTFEPASNGRFINNVVVFSRAEISTHVNIGGNTAPETFTFANNLWYATDDPGQSSPAGDLPAAETDAIEGVEPMLVDLAGGDYHLAAGSPAIGTGMPLPEVAVDLARQCYADPPSRGAFEHF